jgi:two-component system, NtrC family, sensor kinase
MPVIELFWYQEAWMMQQQTTRIRTKVALATLVTVTLVLVCVSGSLFFYFHSLLRESIFKQQFVLVSEIAEQLNGRVQLARHQLSLAATEINSQVLADSDKLQQALTHISSISMIFDAGFLVIGTDGRVIAESMELPELIGMDLRFRDYVKVPLQNGKPFISAPFRLSLPPHNPMIAMAFPVRDSDDRILCLLVGYHSLGDGQFLTSLSSKGLGSTGYLFLLQGRTIIMHPDSKRILDIIAEGRNRGIDQALKGVESSLDNVNSNGQHMLSSFKRVGETGWILAANIPYEDAFGPLNRLAFHATLLAAGGIAVSLLVVWYVTRRMTKPIQQLISHVDGFSTSGGEWKSLQLKTGDELERLANAFNGMMDEIRRADEALRQSSETYRIVAEYTSEIAFWRTLDNSVKFISANCLDITGYRDAEFYAAPSLLDELIHPDDRSLWRCTRESQDRQDAHAPVQIRILCKDGSTRWMNHSCHLVCDEDGQVTGIRGSFSDITETIQAQQRVSDEKFFVENLINRASTPIFVIDRKHTVLYWNRALEIISGKAASDLKGTDLHWSGFYAVKRKTLADLVIEGDTGLDTIYTSYSPSKYFPGGFQAEGWYDIGGKHRYLTFEAAPIRNSKGQVIAAIETLEDITERRQMEDSLARLSRAVEQSPVSIVMTDSDGAIEYVNPKFCRITGYACEEVIGQNSRILKSGDMAASEYETLWRTIRAGKEWRGELHNKRKDGSLFWEFATISPLIDKDGLITGYLAVKEDITERKLVEIVLDQSRKELEAKHHELEMVFRQVDQGKHEWEETLDHLRDFVILTDAVHRIRRCNKLLTDITGRSFKDLIGEDWRNLLIETGFNFENFNGNNGELLNEHSHRTYDVNMYEISNKGTLEGHVVSLNDTTELRIATRELARAYSELKEAQLQIFQQEKMASIGQLAAGVAHEINNPMGFISSNLGTLNKYVERLAEYIDAGDQVLQACRCNAGADRLAEERKRLKIDHIMGDARQLIIESLDGASRVRHIVQDLRSFSRVDQAQQEPTDLNKALETTINIAWNEIKYVADLTREFGDIPEILCFPQQINQVFLNLLVNAGHALEGTRGSIDIRTWCEAEDVFVSIADTGCGIPVEIQQRIFEPFFTTKGVGKGTGLGLSISYDIIRKHEGKITVESEAGRGTTFTVRLPIAGTALKPGSS